VIEKVARILNQLLIQLYFIAGIQKLLLYFYSMIQGIRHIIFDLGGVLLNIDYKRTEDAFKKAGITDFDAMYSKLHQTTLFDDWETGRIGREEFIGALQASSSVPLTKEQIIKCWDAMLLDFPLRRLQLLQQLRLHYDIFLLSNTNEIHEEAFNKILMDERGIPNIGVFFDRVYFSHRVGLRKPMAEIFQLVLGESQLDAAHTLFIDDSLQHIEGAKKLGIQTIHLDKGMTIEKDIFKSKG
jgi:FMN phosphatase YigB (HAD superfamily)